MTATVSAGGNAYDTPVLVTDGFIRLSGGSIQQNGGTLTVHVHDNTELHLRHVPHVVNAKSGMRRTRRRERISPVSTTGGSLKVIAGVSDLSITKSDSPDPVAHGSTLTYTLNVTNACPDLCVAMSRSSTRFRPGLAS